MKVGVGRWLCNRSRSRWLMDSQKGNDAMGRKKGRCRGKTSGILNCESSWMFSDYWSFFEEEWLSCSILFNHRVFFKILRLIRWIEQNEFGQKWGLSPGYSDYFPTATAITTQSQLSLCRALNCTFFMHHSFCPIRLIHLIRRKFLYFEKVILSITHTEWSSIHGAESLHQNTLVV